MINCEEEKLEFEALPEFIREPYSSPKESYLSASGAELPSLNRHRPSVAERMAEFMNDHKDNHASSLPKTAELEALWPGVNNDFFQPSKRSASFYLTLGFMGGAIVSLVAVWLYSMMFHGGGSIQASAPQSESKKIFVAADRGTQSSAQGKDTIAQASQTVTTVQGSGSELITPGDSVYEVKNGDTLAGIALHEYKRVSPRLMDALCRANGMRNADRLSLGQKLTMPPYRTQPTQIAAGSGRTL